ncbi:MAG: 3'-5' exoribonuclease YhaM family protein [Opitutales bacterium]
MDEPLTIAEIKAIPQDRKERFQAVLLLKRADIRTARNGSPYLQAELADKTGSMTVNCFDGSVPFNAFSEAAPGVVARVGGTTEYFNDRLSPKLSQVEILDDDAAGPWLNRLVDSAPEDADDLWSELQAAVAAIPHDGLRLTVEKALETWGDGFRTRAAAIAMHHAYRNGLLEHTVHMVRACRSLLPHYPEVDASLALAGVILHDLGKVTEYTGDRVTGKSRSGILQGHVVLGYRMVRKAGLQAGLDEDLLERLEHIVLSHQGEPAWGAAVMAATPEAVFVSMIDNLDAKMGMVQAALRKRQPGEVFADYHPGLQATLLTEPPHSAAKEPSP